MGQFLCKWREAHPEAQWIPVEERKHHYVDCDPSNVYDKQRSHAIITTPGFYATMEPIIGAIEAIRELDQVPGVHVSICTAPFGIGAVAAKCEQEKREWVSLHLGE